MRSTARCCSRAPPRSRPRRDGMADTVPPTQLAAEWREAPAVLRRQDEVLPHPVSALIHHLQTRAPRLIVTCARGSSAHAATYGKHLFERHLGLPVAAAAPNIAS